MSGEKKGKWGGNRKGKYDFLLDAPTVRIPKPYHDACQKYAKQLEDEDVRNGKVYQDENGNWIYKE